MKDNEIIEKLRELKEKDAEFRGIIDQIHAKIQPIITAIESKDYDTDVACCPTYWSVIKRFL